MRNATPQPDKPASIDFMADCDFKAYEKGVIEVPTNTVWAEISKPHMVTLRISQKLCEQSKPELVETLEKDDDATREIMRLLRDAVDFFEAFAELASKAECRVLCALASTVAGEKFRQERIAEVAAATGQSIDILKAQAQDMEIEDFHRWADGQTGSADEGAAS